MEGLLTIQGRYVEGILDIEDLQACSGSFGHRKPADYNHRRPVEIILYSEDLYMVS